MSDVERMIAGNRLTRMIVEGELERAINALNDISELRGNLAARMIADEVLERLPNSATLAARKASYTGNKP